MDWDLHLPDRPVTIGHRVQTFGLPEAAQSRFDGNQASSVLYTALRADIS